MKHFLLSVSILLIMLPSCKKEETPGLEVKNMLTYEGVETTIKEGVIYDYGNEALNGTVTYANYNHDIVLYTEGLTIVDAKNGDLSGIGNKIRFEFWSGSPKLATATYKINLGVRDKNLSISGSDIAIHYNAAKNEAEKWSNIVSGTVHVNNLGSDVYEITVDCTDETGKKVTAYYNQKLAYIVVR